MVTLKSLLIKPSHLYIQENQEFPTGGFFMVARENSDFEYSADCPWLSDLKTDVLHVSNTLPNSSNTTLFICPSGGWDNFDQQQIFDSLKVGVDLLSAAYKLKDEERNPIPLEGKKLDEFLGMCAFVLKRDFELHGLITPRISNKY